jgi:uncharacterized phage infection (PIP) family protein YhgE
VLEVAGELYGLPPGEFTAARNERAKEARSDGGKEAAEALKGLRKPSTAAWVVNMLMRHEADQMEQVLAVGESLRKAQEGLDAASLRELTKQRRQLTAAVTAQGRSLARELGQKVTDAVADQVQDTLHAAMIDEAAAKAVRSGMLVEPLTSTGIEQVDISGAVAVPEAVGVTAPRATAKRGAAAKKRAAGKATEEEPAGKPQLSVVEDRTRRIDEARDRLRQAESDAETAQRGVDKAQRRVSRLEARSLQVQGELDELRRKVADLEHKLESVEDELSDAEDTRDEAQSDLDEARAAVDRAREALERLEG